MQGELLVPVGQRAAGKTDLENVSVEFGDLGPPAAQHLLSEQTGVATARKDGIGIVVNHHPIVTPQHHHGDRRAHEDADRRAQAHRPLRDGTQAGGGPVETGDQVAKLAATRQKRQFCIRNRRGDSHLRSSRLTPAHDLTAP